MKIFGFFGVLAIAQEHKLNLRMLNDTRPRSINTMFMTNIMGEDYASMANNTELADIFYEENLWKYGCWGQTNDDEIQSGLGEPLDAIDQLFQDWKKCTECRNLDFGSTSMTDYFHHMIFNSYFDGTRFVCNSLVDVHRARCQCDDALAFGILQNFGDYNSEYELQNGFDFESNCRPHPKSTSNYSGITGVKFCDDRGENQRRCCGEYPKRLPYNDRAGLHPVLLCCECDLQRRPPRLLRRRSRLCRLLIAARLFNFYDILSKQTFIIVLNPWW